MGATVRVGFSGDPTTRIFDELNEKYGCDFGYGTFYLLWSELKIVPTSDGGTIGKMNLNEFVRVCLDYPYDGEFPERVILLLRLCHYGRLQGADIITWA